MRDIIAAIEQKKREFAQLPLFEYMRDKSIDPLQRLAFAPCAAPFVMSFGELNKDAYRDESSNDKIQAILNKHTYEDDHHWQWFLEDLEKLGLNPPLSFNDALRFLWGEETHASRQIAYELYRLTSQANPVQKLVVMEVAETTGNTIFEVSAQIIQELAATTDQKYRYFGRSHLLVEEHTYTSPEDKQLIESIQLTETEQKEYMEVVENVFAVFTELTHALLAYAKAHRMNRPMSNITPNPNHIPNPMIEQEVDYLIIGAGPAGLQLGYFLEQAKRDYLILEAGESPGTSFKQFPRHRQLISINKRYTGYDDPEIKLRWDWNSLLNDGNELQFTDYSKAYFPDASDLVRYLGDFANRFKLNIEYDTQVVSVTKDGKFRVTDSRGNVYTCQRLIIATGLAKPYLPPIPGIELAENYTDVSVDAEDFNNQKVLIIGKGNSGFETADRLAATASAIHVVSPNSIQMAWKSRYVGHLRAINNSILDTYQLKSQNIILDAFVKKIEKRGDQFVVAFSYSHADSEQEDLVYDRVIVCTGFRLDTSIFDETCCPELTINDRFPRQTSAWESTNVKELYFAGVLMHMRDFKKKASGFIHGFRYNIRALHHLFEQKYHQNAWPSQLLEPTGESLTEAIIKRINRSSALWQQTGLLCDLLVVPESGESAQYYEDMPADYIQDSEFGQHSHYYTVSLEFGYELLKTIPDPFAIVRIHKDDTDNAALSTGIHPIIRRYCGSKLLAEHHVIEDVASEWAEDVHVAPLVQFLAEQLSGKVTERLSGKEVEQLSKKVTTKRIGTYLIEAGLVTLEQLQEVLDEQTRIAMPLGKLLADRGWVSQQTVEFMMENVILPERQLAIKN